VTLWCRGVPWRRWRATFDEDGALFLRRGTMSPYAATPGDRRALAWPAKGSPTSKRACSHVGNMLTAAMRVIARSVLVDFWGKHPEVKVSLERWHTLVRAAKWTSTDEIQKAAPKAKVLNRERVRFEVAGGNYRLVAAFDFRRQIAFVKFIGTHA